MAGEELKDRVKAKLAVQEYDIEEVTRRVLANYPALHAVVKLAGFEKDLYEFGRVMLNEGEMIKQESRRRG